MADKVRFGILGPGNIVERVMADFHQVERGCVTAVASRSLDRARAAAQRYGAAHAFGSYEELARCPEVDAVYVATPHNFHADQAVLMMEHGKHVLCEKPLTVSGGEARRMVDCARKQGVFLMEAMWTRFFPASARLRDLLAQGTIGPVRYLTASFAFASKVDPKSRLYDPALAGGALLDVGVYALMAATGVLGWKPVRVSSECTLASTGVDSGAFMQLRYEDGAVAHLMAGMTASTDHKMMIYGARGRIEVPDFWHPTQLRVSLCDGSSVVYQFPEEREGFRHEFRHVCECILAGRTQSPVVSWEESVAVSELMEAMRREWGVIYPFEQQ